jgi:hypothetical protein
MATDAIEKTNDAISQALGALQTDEPVVEPESVESPAAEVAEAPSEPEQPEQPEEVAEASSALAELAEEAKQYYGLSDSDIERAGENLPWILAHLDQQASVLNHSDAPAEPQQPQRQPPKEDAPKPLADLEAFDFPIDEDEWTDNQRKILDAFKGEINKQRTTVNEHRKAMEMMAQALVETHKTASETRRQTESISDAEFAGTMDDFFAKLPDEFADVYGKEPMSSLSHNSPRVAARNALVKEMQSLKDSDARLGRPARSLKDQATRTIRALHADKAHQVARREVDKKLKDYGKGRIAKPSSRGDSPVDRKARALAAIEKFAPKLGI